MDYETLFLMGVYLLPLGFVSLVGAWSRNRRPWLAAGLALVSVGIFAYILLTRPEGLFRLRDIPELTVVLIARVASIF